MTNILSISEAYLATREPSETTVNFHAAHTDRRILREEFRQSVMRPYERYAEFRVELQTVTDSQPATNGGL